MKHHLLFTLVLTVFASHSAYADRTQAEFFQSFLTPYLRKTCQDKAIFRQCFTINQADCEKSVRGMAQLCEKPLSRRMPETLKTKRDAGFWGSQYAVCIARRFAEIHAKSLNKNQKGCRNLLTKRHQRKLPTSDKPGK